MPRPRKPARLWLRPASAERAAAWIILDGSRQLGTGCGADARGEAERRLADYLASKHDPLALPRQRPAAQTLIADVLSIYLDEVAPRQAPAKAVARRVARLLDWWGERTLADITATTCAQYAAREVEVVTRSGRTVVRKGRGGARRDLEDLRAAVNHHAKRELHTGLVLVDLPSKGQARQRFLTRSEVARLVWTCWRADDTPDWHHECRALRAQGMTFKALAAHFGRSEGSIANALQPDRQRPLRHLARFILTAVYTASRSGAVLSASVHAAAGRSYLDLDAGIFYRLADGAAETSKRQPPVPIPPRLMPHLRRWRDRGVIASYVVEWHAMPVRSVKVAWSRAVREAGLAGRVTPHTLRHTACTWLMHQGVPTSLAAAYAGMSEQVFKQTYEHHHPDFMGEAARRIGFRRQ
jgi:integrase